MLLPAPFTYPNSDPTISWSHVVDGIHKAYLDLPNMLLHSIETQNYVSIGKKYGYLFGGPARSGYRCFKAAHRHPPTCAVKVVDGTAQLSNWACTTCQQIFGS